jgi:CAAX prenyl protease-like protein
MKKDSKHPEQLTKAHVVPFAVFMVFLIVLQLADSLIGWSHPAAPWWKRDVAQWIYPIQTLAIFMLLIRYWKSYTFNWNLKWSVIGVVFGIVGIGFWLLPTTLYDAWGLSGPTDGWMKWLGIAKRDEGFDPGIFENPVAYWASLSMRFLRAVVIVALVEEIFWRGFVMRFCMDWEGDYWKQPFGRAHVKSYLIVTLLFMFAHAPIDWAGALFYGSLTYLMCVWSKSLGACIVMHAVANLLMGIYAIAYGKYGLW